MTIDNFKIILKTSESFYFTYHVDSGGQLTKLFQADAIGQRNCELYGDVVWFEVSFDTNKYENYTFNSMIKKKYKLFIIFSKF